MAFAPSTSCRSAYPVPGALSGTRQRIGGALDRLAPRIPDFEREAVLDHACDNPSLARATPETAAWLSLTAYVRHVLTDYDALLAEGYDRDSARFFVADRMTEILVAWGCRRTLDEGGEA